MLKSSVLAFAFASVAASASASAEEPVAVKNAPTVSVVGLASEDVRPDIAVVTFSIADERATPNDAASENARLSAAVIDALKSSGVEEKDIVTIGLSLFPQWSDERDVKTSQVVKRVLTSYRASNTLSVRIRTIDKAGAIIAQGVQNGAEYQNVAFDISNRDAREDALRAKAVSNAMHRAALYASGASMKLGSIEAINAEGAQPAFRGPMGVAKSFSLAAPVAVEPGVISLSETVTATWDLAPQ
jgi:uncharacterized protein